MTIQDRKQHYAAIHAIAKDLSLSDVRTRRQIWYSITGQYSCTTMRPTELVALRNFLSQQLRDRTPAQGLPAVRVSDAQAKAVLG